MKLAWYVNRLRNMEPAEVIHRLGEAARKTASRRRRGGWAAWRAGEMATVFPDLQARILPATDAQRDAIASAARDALGGRFRALGRDWPVRAPGALYPDDLWRLDPVTGNVWPGAGTYTFDIDYRHDGSRGDIKYAWEIGRLQTLPVLACHHLLSGAAAALTAIEQAIESWHRANPPFTGIGWASGIEVALRAISLIVTRDLLGERLPPETQSRIGQILSASLYWLKRFPSRFSSANNHLIAELAGEYLVGLALRLPVGDVRAKLDAETLRQILADGCGAEQTPTYAAFSVEMILMCLTAGHLRGETVERDVRQRLLAFADHIAWLPPGTSYGDDDEGRVLTLGDETDYPRSVAAAVHAFLQAPGLPAAPGDFRALIHGLPPATAAPPAGLRVFAQGGLSVWHGTLAGRAVALTFDHGPLGYLSIAAHGHADALAVTLCLDGRPVLIDPGTWLYGSGGAWRNWFRSTPAHNTLNIDGESQSLMSGAFNWSKKATTRLVAQAPEPQWSLTGEQDGYRQRFGVVHRRTIRRLDNAIVLTDRLIGGTRRAELVFQLAPGLAVDVSGRRVRVLCEGRPLLDMALPDAAITLHSGEDGPGGGWVSPRFGVRQPATRILWNGPVGETGVETILTPQPQS